jgi:uncharacterized protein YndB with AHSA1/START domain
MQPSWTSTVNISDIDAITSQIFINARPETVYAFFTDPEKLRRWMGTSVELDLPPDGAFRINVNGRDRASGAFVELVPHSRIVFTWGWDDPQLQIPPGATTVEVTLTPAGAGTHVRLVHRGLAAPELRDTHRAGWDHYLSRLAVAAPGGDPGPDPFLKEDTP